MKKVAAVCCIAALLLALSPAVSQAKVDRKPGGIPAFLVGCCWGIREGSEWNEGADMHWREWLRIVPYLGVVFMVWDGVDCYGGITSAEWAKKNSANWY